MTGTAREAHAKKIEETLDDMFKTAYMDGNLAALVYKLVTEANNTGHREGYRDGHTAGTDQAELEAYARGYGEGHDAGTDFGYGIAVEDLENLLDKRRSQS